MPPRPFLSPMIIRHVKKYAQNNCRSIDYEVYIKDIFKIIILGIYFQVKNTLTMRSWMV